MYASSSLTPFCCWLLKASGRTYTAECSFSRMGAAGCACARVASNEGGAAAREDTKAAWADRLENGKEDEPPPPAPSETSPPSTPPMLAARAAAVGPTTPLGCASNSVSCVCGRLLLLPLPRADPEEDLDAEATPRADTSPCCPCAAMTEAGSARGGASDTCADMMLLPTSA